MAGFSSFLEGAKGGGTWETRNCTDIDPNEKPHTTQKQNKAKNKNADRENLRAEFTYNAYFFDIVSFSACCYLNIKVYRNE